MKEPVQTVFGTCYEEEALMTCVEMNGWKDPVSLMKIEPNSGVVKNRAIKKLIQEFLKKNPWSFEKIDDSEDDIQKIMFDV